MGVIGLHLRGGGYRGHHQGRGTVKESKGLWTRVGGYKQKRSPSFITVGPEVV